MGLEGVSKAEGWPSDLGLEDVKNADGWPRERGLEGIIKPKAGPGTWASKA